MSKLACGARCLPKPKTFPARFHRLSLFLGARGWELEARLKAIVLFCVLFCYVLIIEVASYVVAREFSTLHGDQA